VQRGLHAVQLERADAIPVAGALALHGGRLFTGGQVTPSTGANGFIRAFDPAGGARSGEAGLDRARWIAAARSALAVIAHHRAAHIYA